MLRDLPIYKSKLILIILNLKKKASTMVKLNVYTDERILTEDFRSKNVMVQGLVI
jgi:hypothetical protein